ncbi:hypothetical protein IEQ34_022131 [Dendrobium chrysotoxum]|uniref:Uncharacterized protein n=1 Tax=Dendrobium chrysotoxum TaxID=161865 RepID=A0AAV7FWC9_DENCH|nr:hypothetical protein IEQ34_022131 [Dendrobium chrysotoxum]
MPPTIDLDVIFSWQFIGFKSGSLDFALQLLTNQPHVLSVPTIFFKKLIHAFELRNVSGKWEKGVASTQTQAKMRQNYDAMRFSAAKAMQLIPPYSRTKREIVVNQLFFSFLIFFFLDLITPFFYSLVGKFSFGHPSLEMIHCFMNDLHLSGDFTSGFHIAITGLHILIYLRNLILPQFGLYSPTKCPLHQSIYILHYSFWDQILGNQFNLVLLLLDSSDHLWPRFTRFQIRCGNSPMTWTFYIWLSFEYEIASRFMDATALILCLTGNDSAFWDVCVVLFKVAKAFGSEAFSYDLITQYVV